MIVSGLASTSSIFDGVKYAPCLRIVGNTSPVIHFLNDLASGFRLSKMTSYNPSSFMTVALFGLPKESGTVSVETMSSVNLSLT
ncbi:hypothetical protein D3C72_1653590 [compost metagenome]